MFSAVCSLLSTLTLILDTAGMGCPVYYPSFSRALRNLVRKNFSPILLFLWLKLSSSNRYTDSAIQDLAQECTINEMEGLGKKIAGEILCKEIKHNGRKKNVTFGLILCVLTKNSQSLSQVCTENSETESKSEDNFFWRCFGHMLFQLGSFGKKCPVGWKQLEIQGRRSLIQFGVPGLSGELTPGAQALGIFNPCRLFSYDL